MQPSRVRPNPSRDLRDFTVPSDSQRWMIGNSVQVDGNAPTSAPHWDPAGVLNVNPGHTLSYLLVASYPGVDSFGYPTPGAFDIDEVDCIIYQWPQSYAALFDLSFSQSTNGQITPASSGSLALQSFNIANTMFPFSWVINTTGTASGGVLSPTAFGPQTLSGSTIIPATIPLALQPNLPASPLVLPSFSLNNGVITSSVNTGADQAGVEALVGLSLYVSMYDESTHTWEVKSALVPSDMMSDRILDFKVDAFAQPWGFFGYTSRYWSVSLPYPIRIGSGQALVVTLANFSQSQIINPLPFIRTRVREVA